MRRNLSCTRLLLGAFVVVFATSFCPPARTADGELSDELAAIRGANYTPSYAR